MDRGGSSVLVYGIYAFLAMLAFLPSLFLMHLNSGARSQVDLPRKKRNALALPHFPSLDRTYTMKTVEAKRTLEGKAGERAIFFVSKVSLGGERSHGGASKEGEDRRRQASTQGQSYIGRAGKPPPPTLFSVEANR